jgi:hypothetical protein
MDVTAIAHIRGHVVSHEASPRQERALVLTRGAVAGASEAEAHMLCTYESEPTRGSKLKRGGKATDSITDWTDTMLQLPLSSGVNVVVKPVRQLQVRLVLSPGRRMGGSKALSSAPRGARQARAG